MKKAKYLFGPVPSRRLGLSLGVDIVDLKTCTQNCIYCQLGIDAKQTTQRKPYVDIDLVIAELKEKISAGLVADYITISGSGEPTLNSRLGELIEKIKKTTGIPVAVITNGTLLSDPQVRKDCSKADAVLPSLDAGDEETFEKINKPAKNIHFDDFIDGLIKFRKEFKGQFWLEVFFCKDVNTSDEQIQNIKSIVEKIHPDKVQLNTAVRPVANSSAICVNRQQMQEIAQKLANNAEVIASFSKEIKTDTNIATQDAILEMLKRRPCSLDDICASLGANRNEVLKTIQSLTDSKKITQEIRDKKLYFKPELI